MNKRTISTIFVVAILILILAVWIVIYLPEPKPPISTPTPKPSLTSTLVISPTLTISPQTKTPTPTKTVKLTSTPTITSTPEPTKIILKVNTGYKPGYLHFRRGPGKSYTPLWEYRVGALSEGEQVIFIECFYSPYPWASVKYNVFFGYVYSKFVFPNPCK